MVAVHLARAGRLLTPRRLRLFAIGSLLAMVSTTPVAAAQADDGFAVAGASVDALVIDGPWVAVLRTSSMGERSLLVAKRPSGEEVLRRDNVTGRLLQVVNGHVLFESAGSPTVIDLVSGQAWSVISAGEGAASACLTRDSAFGLLRRGADPAQLVQQAHPDANGVPALKPIGPVPADAELICGESAVAASSAREQRAIVWSDQQWTSVALDGRGVLAIGSDRLYAQATPGTNGAIDTREWSGGNWQPADLPVSGEPVTGVRMAGDGHALLIGIYAQAGTTDVMAVTAGQTRRLAVIGASPAWSSDGQSLALLTRRDGRWWIAIRPVSEPTTVARRPVGALNFAIDPDVDRVALALKWLEDQLGRSVQTPVGAGRLIDSYEDDRRVGWTYDAALAAITFTAANRPDLARDVLAGLAQIQRDDGSWDFAYDSDAVRGLDGRRYVGSMAWVVMAVNFYESETHDRAFSPMAERGLQFIDRFIIRDSASPLDGGVSMGPAAPQTFSAEHNADVYSALSWRARLTGRDDYAASAAAVRAFIWRQLWTGDAPDASYFRVGQQDDTLYLDAQTWMALALAAVPGDRERLERGVDTAERRLSTAAGHVGQMNDIHGVRDTAATDATTVWSEGSEGMVAARLLLGQTDRALAQHAETRRLQTVTGGVIYATDNDDGWSTRPSVAGTAWFVLNGLPTPRNPFAPGESHPATESTRPADATPQ
jgi:hypothetical protein